MQVPVGFRFGVLGAAVTVAAGLQVASPASAGTAMPPWKMQMIEARRNLAGAGATFSSGSVGGGFIDIADVTYSYSGFGGQNELDAVLWNYGSPSSSSSSGTSLLNFGSSDVPAGFDSDGFTVRSGVGQSDLDFDLLNFGDSDIQSVYDLPGTSYHGSSSQNELDDVLLTFGDSIPTNLTLIGAPEPDEEYGEFYNQITGSTSLTTSSVADLNESDLIGPALLTDSYSSFASFDALPNTAAPGDNASSVAAVPEPAGALVLLGLTGCFAGRRRQA
ncbi:MAG: hypothetical protein AAF333_10980 [Planctomycetota bacterium]